MREHGELADHPQDAGKFAGEVRKNMSVAVKRFEAAFDLLTSQPGVDRTRVAAIGYCFGGSIVLEMAARGQPLASVASFHGTCDFDVGRRLHNLETLVSATSASP